MMNFEKIANYVLYIGLNDKDTYKQIIDNNLAMQTVRDIVSQRVSGATFSRAFGHWVDEFGNETTEQTIVCKIMYTDDKKIESICENLKHKLNQNCIMVEKNLLEVAFV